MAYDVDLERLLTPDPSGPDRIPGVVPGSAEAIARHQARVAADLAAIQQRTRREWLDSPLADLPGLDEEIDTYLEEASPPIIFVRQLVQRTATDLILLKGISGERLRQIKAALETVGLSLAEQPRRAA